MLYLPFASFCFHMASRGFCFFISLIFIADCRHSGCFFFQPVVCVVTRSVRLLAICQSVTPVERHEFAASVLYLVSFPFLCFTLIIPFLNLSPAFGDDDDDDYDDDC